MLPPNPAVQVKPYAVPRALAPTDLRLDGNEGNPPDSLPWDGSRAREIAGRYPDATHLEAVLAARFERSADEVLVTAGADDALDRVCRAFLGPSRNIVLPTPGFEMMSRYASITGAEVRAVAWPEGSFPVDAFVEASDRHTGVVVVTSPNNPTGAVATAEDVEALLERIPQALVLCDLAYVEFADDDPTLRIQRHERALVVRTLSKAWGLAGLRIGYALGKKDIIGWLRAAGAPFAVAGPSIMLAEAVLHEGPPPDRFVDTIRRERTRLSELLVDLGARVRPSQANFVLADVRDAFWFRDALAGFGIAVRAFPGRAGLENAVRISCPGSSPQMDRLARALSTVLRPVAISGPDEVVDGAPLRRIASAEPGSWAVVTTPAEVETARAVGALPIPWPAAEAEALQRAGAGPLLANKEELMSWIG